MAQGHTHCQCMCIGLGAAPCCVFQYKPDTFQKSAHKQKGYYPLQHKQTHIHVHVQDILWFQSKEKKHNPYSCAQEHAHTHVYTYMRYALLIGGSIAHQLSHP